MVKATLSIWMLTMSVSAEAATYGQQVLAAVLLAEARSEGERGMTAVAEVIRLRADRWHVSPLAVVKRDKDFSCLIDKSPPQLIREFQAHDDWGTALAIARRAYNHPEQLPGVSRRATHYHSGPPPEWARGERPVAVVGALKFYRLPLSENL